MRQVTAALDFGTSKVFCIVGEKDNTDKLAILGYGECPYMGFFNGYWLQPEKLKQSIAFAVAEAESRCQRKIDKLVIGVPGEYIKTSVHRVLIQPEGDVITDNDIKRLLTQGSELYIPNRYCIIQRTPAYFMLDNKQKIQTPLHIKSKQLAGWINYISANIVFLEEVTHILDLLKIETEEFISTSYAQGMMCIPMTERHNISVLIDTGHYSTQIAVFEGSGMIYHASIPIGGAYMTAEIADKLQISFEQAEQLKHNYETQVLGKRSKGGNLPEGITSEGNPLSAVDTSQLLHCMDRQTDQACQSIKSELLKTDCLEGKPTVYLTGGGFSFIKGFTDVLSKVLGCSVKMGATKTLMLSNPNYTSGVALLNEVFALRDRDRHEASDFTWRMVLTEKNYSDEGGNSNV